MTRSDLVEELAARFSQLTHRDAEFAVKAILDAINDALVRLVERAAPKPLRTLAQRIRRLGRE